MNNNFSFVEDQALTDVNVATFTVPNVTDTEEDFAATIDWGDGSEPDTDTTIEADGNGVFHVLGGHTYAEGGRYDVTVEVAQAWSSLAQAIDFVGIAIGVAPPVQAQLKLTSLSFLGGVSFTERDTGGQYDRNNQWVQGVTPKPYVPYVYQRNATLKVNARFTNQDRKFAGTIDIRGRVMDQTLLREGRQLGTITKNGVSISAGQAEVVLENLVSDTPFVNKVTWYEPLAIIWEIRRAGEVNWNSAGTSTNVIYLTWRKPTNKPQYLLPTMVALGCKSAFFEGGPGATTDPQLLLEAIWKRFATKEVFRYEDFREMKYYGTWTVPRVNPKRQLAAGFNLVRGLDGQCTNWAQFFMDVLNAQGLPGNNGIDEVRILVIEPIDLRERFTGGFLITPWQFSGGGGGTYPYSNAIGPAGIARPRFLIDNSYGWPKYITGPNNKPVRAPALQARYLGNRGGPLLGQNNPNPVGSFPTHVIVRIGTDPNSKLYDPSYGRDYDDLQELQDFVIEGYYITVDDGKNAFWQIRKVEVGDELGIQSRNLE